jgi:DNA polymerase III delta prime subunit
MQVNNIIELEEEPLFLHEAAERAPIEQLEELVLRWSPRRTERIKSAFKTWLEEAKKSSKDGVSRILVVSGEWGTGKTTLAKTVFQGIITQNNLTSRYLVFEDLIREIRGICGSNCYPVDAFENFFTQLVDKEGATYDRPLILLLDEVEGIIGLDNESPVGGLKLSDAFVKMLREFLGGRELHFGKSLKGRIHLVLFVTPHALNFIQSKLSSVGYEGWLNRREDIISIYSLTKNEFVEFGKALLEYTCKRASGDIIDDYRIFEFLYIVTNGNIGKLVSLVRRLVNTLYLRCTEEQKKTCIYKINVDNFLYFLEQSIQIPTVDFTETKSLVNFDFVGNILNKANKFPQTVSEQIKKIIFTASNIPESELDEESKIILPNFKIESYVEQNIFRPYKLYKIGSDRETLQKLLFILSEKLKEINSDTSTEELLICVSALVSLTKNGEYLIAIPITDKGNIDIDELNNVLLSYKFINIPNNVEDFLKSLLQNYPSERGIGISAVFKTMLYPAYSPRIIPFISDVRTAMDVFSFLKNFSPDNIKKIEDYSYLTLLEMLKEAGYIEEHQLKDYLRMYSIKNYENSVVSIKFILGSPQLENRLFATRDNVCTIIISQYALEIPNKPWNVFFIQMSLQDIQMLAARKHVDLMGKANYIDKQKLNDFYSTILHRYKFQEIFEEWKKKAKEKGIVISEKIGFENDPLVLDSKRKPYLVFLDYYRALLVGGSSCSRDELEDLLLNLYRVRPFEGLNGIPLPDVEPDNPLKDNNNEVLKQRIKNLVNQALHLAQSIGVATFDENTKTICLSLWPAEERILELLSKKNSSLSLADLEKEFVFEKSEGNSEVSRNLFEEFVLKMLESRGLVEISTLKKKGKSSEETVFLKRLSENDVLSLLVDVNQRKEKIKEDLQAVPKIHLNSSLCHVFFSKQKGSKIIFLSDIDDLLQRYINKLETSKDPVIFNIVFILANYMEEIFNKYIVKALSETKNIQHDLEKYKSDIDSKLGKNINDLSKVLPPDVLEEIRKSAKFDKDKYHEALNKILAKIDTYLSLTKDSLVEELVKQESDLRQIFMFRESVVPLGTYVGSKITHFHNYILFKIQEIYRNEFLGLKNDIDSVLQKLEDAVNRTLDSVQMLDQTVIHKIAKEKWHDLYGDKGLTGGLPGIIDFLEHLIVEFSKKGEKLQQRENLIREIIQKHESATGLLKELSEILDKDRNRLEELKGIFNVLGEIESLKSESDWLKERLGSVEDRLKQIQNEIKNFRIGG